MKIDKEGKIDVFKNIIEHRPWGYFGLYADNEPCTCKILFIKSGEMLSLQLHQKRSQFYYLIDPCIIRYSVHPVPHNLLGNIKALKTFAAYDMITLSGQEGDLFGFKKRVIHRVGYVGPRDYGRLLDIAFGENDENDIIRIEDKYGRE